LALVLPDRGRATWRVSREPGADVSRSTSTSPYCWSTRTSPLRRWRRRGCAAGRVRTRREDVLHELHPVGGHADRLLMVLPMLAVHHRTTHRRHLRDGGQVHQPFALELVLDAFGDAFVEPQGVDERLIGHALARVALRA
jgi:hypothetical protein